MASPSNREAVLPFGQRLPQIAVRPPGPRSLRWGERLRAVECRNVTPVTPEFPVFWKEARGANLRDVDGNVYLDLTGAFGVALLGHSPKSVADAIKIQSEVLTHAMGDLHPSPLKVELMDRLVSLSPWDEARATLASTGSEAVEIALKTALLATGRPGILAFEGGYHGLTLGALASTGRAAFREPFAPRLYRGVSFVPFPAAGPSAGEATRAALERVGEALSRAEGRGEPVGAVIAEPVQGRAGVRIPPSGFFAELAKVVRAAGAILIFDEVFTGFGRTGSLFACMEEGVVPDLLCVGKALGGGLPMSACIGPPAVMDAWPPSAGEALHTSTFLGHPLSCAAALAFLGELSSEGAMERVTVRGARLLDGLSRQLTDVPRVGEVRGRGLLLGIELVGPGGGELWRNGGARVAEAALQEGLLVLPAGDRGEVVELAPPISITEEQIDWSVETLGRVIRAMV